MNNLILGWGLFFVSVGTFIMAIVLLWRNSSRTKAREEKEIEFLRGGPADPSLRKREVVPCEGCGCLLHRVPGFEQPATIARVQWHRFDGSSTWVNNIVEHYLCIRCQADGWPLAKKSTVEGGRKR